MTSKSEDSMESIQPIFSICPDIVIPSWWVTLRMHYEAVTHHDSFEALNRADRREGHRPTNPDLSLTMDCQRWIPPAL